MYFLGVDNGLTRTRSVVLNLESASLVALSEVSHDVVDGLPAGQLEQDPSQWIRAVDRTVRHCLEQLGETRQRVAGIGICGQPRGMVLLDGNHRLVRPAKLAADRSATPESEEISRAFGGPPGMIELTGNSMSPADVAASRIDFPAWLATLSHRNRRIALRLAAGDAAGSVAQRFGISPGRISQLRRELAEAWQAFHGEFCPDAVAAVPA